MKTRQVRKSRMAVLVAASIIGITALAACSTEGGGQALAGGETLTIPVNRSPWLPAYKDLVAEYERETGVRIELREFPNEELRTQQINDVQQGTNTFDIFQMDEPFMLEFFSNGWVKPFTDVEPGFALDDQVNSYGNFAYWDDERKVQDPSGDLMAAPLNGNVTIFAYRKDIYEKLGLEVPTTWEEAIANGEIAQKSGDVKHGYVMRTQGLTSGIGLTFEYLPLLYGYGGSWFVEEGSDWTPSVNSPEAIAAARTMRDLAKLGPKETTTIGQAEAMAAVQSGQALQTHMVVAAAPQFESEADSSVAGKIGYAVVPAGPQGARGAGSGVFALGIPSNIDDERAGRALDFIEWIESEEVQLEFAKNGGIPTRSDVLASNDLNDVQKEYFGAVAETIPEEPKGMRYTFTPAMLEVTESILSKIVAGDVSPEEGMETMQEELTEVVQDAGLQMGK